MKVEQDNALKTYEVEVDWETKYFSVNAYNKNDAIKVILEEIRRYVDIDDFVSIVEESDKDLTHEGRGIFG